MTPPSHRAWAIVVAGLAATAGYATLQGQPGQAPGDDMKALVAEVRALRLAVERTSAHASQAQVLLGRVQLQENRLATLGRQYQEARSRVFDAQTTQMTAEQRVQLFTAQLRTVADPSERQALEDHLPELKADVARAQARTAQLQGDEAAALQALTTEQQRWSEFNDRLEALERTLGTPALTR